MKPDYCATVNDVLYRKYAAEWNETLYITLTYNKGDDMKYDPDPIVDLSRRIVNSYVSQRTGSAKFNEVEMDPCKWDSLEGTISAIADHYRWWKKLSDKPRIVFLVDEVIKSDNPTKVLSALCGRMDEISSDWKSLDVITTTLTETMLKNAVSVSNRPLEFIPMPALVSINKLFPPAKNRNATIVALHLGGVWF